MIPKDHFRFRLIARFDRSRLISGYVRRGIGMGAETSIPPLVLHCSLSLHPRLVLLISRHWSEFPVNRNPGVYHPPELHVAVGRIGNPERNSIQATKRQFAHDAARFEVFTELGRADCGNPAL